MMGGYGTGSVYLVAPGDLAANLKVCKSDMSTKVKGLSTCNADLSTKDKGLSTCKADLSTKDKGLDTCKAALLAAEAASGDRHTHH